MGRGKEEKILDEALAIISIETEMRKQVLEAYRFYNMKQYETISICLLSLFYLLLTFGFIASLERP